MNRKLALNIFLTIIFAITTFIGVLHHETWSDEAQVWLILKNVSFVGLFKHLCIEGHPSLFYLICMPFVKLGLSMMAIKIICWAFVVSSVFVLLQFSPFPIFLNLVIIISAPFLYFYPVIARSYSIFPLLIFLCSIFYSKQKQYPLLYACIVALIANLHIIMFAFSFCLATQYFFNNIFKKKDVDKKFYIGFFIMCFTFFVVLFLAFSSLYYNDAITPTQIDFLRILKILLNVIHTQCNILILNYINTALIIWLFYILFKECKIIFSIAFLSVAFHFFIYFTTYGNIIFKTRIYLIYLILLFSFWILYEQKKNIKKVSMILTIIFAFTIPVNILYWKVDLKEQYSQTYTMAQYIKKNVPKNSIIISFVDCANIALVYYLKDDYKFWSIGRNKFFDYCEWRSLYVNTESVLNSKIYLKKIYNFNKVYFILNNLDMMQISINDFLESLKQISYYKKVYEVNKPCLAYNENKYILYEFID